MYKDKPCLICGKTFTPNGPRAKWCDECRPGAVRALKREYEAKCREAKQESNAVYTCDSLDKVVRCLNCTRPVCHGQCDDVMDTSDMAKKKYKEKRMDESIRRVAHFVRAGARDEFIMRELGLTKNQLAMRKSYARAEGLLPSGNRT